MLRYALTLSALAAGIAQAQSSPPWHLEMRFDVETGANRFTAVTVTRDDALVTYAAGDWIRPELIGYAQAASPIVVAMGEPAGPGVPITRDAANLEGLPDEPMPAARRTSLVTDDQANSMLLNIADDMDGMTLRFPRGLINGPGPDVLLAEASLPAGQVSGGCPGVPSAGADPTVVSLPDGGSLTLNPEDFVDFGSAGPQVNHGSDEMADDPDFRMADIETLRELDMRPLASIDYMKVYATALDLSDLGVAPGATVTTLVLSSLGEMTQTDDGPRLCWTADPILLVGLLS